MTQLPRTRSLSDKMNIVKRNASEILFLLVLSDLVIITLHLVTHFSSISSDGYWSVEQDRGFGETFQYIKELWLFLSFAALIKIRSDWSHSSLCLLFGYLLVDDLFSIHERLGAAIAIRFNLSPLFGLRPVDVGELQVFLAVGTILFTIIGISYWFGSKPFRHICQRVMVIFAGLAFFGIPVDAIHAIFRESDVLNLWLSLIEDGGEMLLMSLLCWYGVSLLQPRATLQIEPTAMQPESFLQR